MVVRAPRSAAIFCFEAKREEKMKTLLKRCRLLPVQQRGEITLEQDQQQQPLCQLAPNRTNNWTLRWRLSAGHRWRFEDMDDAAAAREVKEADILTSTAPAVVELLREYRVLLV